MRLLLKTALIFACVFASTFFIARLSGNLTIPQIEGWLEAANSVSPWVLATVVFCLLFADLFVAVPTLTLCLLSGFFLGFHAGSLAAIMGMMCAGIAGHLLSKKFGEAILRRISKDQTQITDAKEAFCRHGVIMILISRASPILPEVCACLSGVTKMPFKRFLAAWSISTMPYSLIAVYAGSISTLDNPKPAIFTALGITVFLWVCWYLLHRRRSFA
jgi:uncharacterized membrane protein YdjX (TVP38/TMEM64 family)